MISPLDSVPVITLSKKNNYWKIVAKTYQENTCINKTSYEDFYAASAAAKVFAHHNNYVFLPYNETFISIYQTSVDKNFVVVKVNSNNHKLTNLAAYQDIAFAVINGIAYAGEHDLTFAPFWLLGKSQMSASYLIEDVKF